MKKLPLTIIICILLTNTNNTYSYYSENSSTSEIEYIEPILSINEISFKDNENDWIELEVVDDGNNGKGSKINNFYLKDDTKFLEITSNFILYTGNFIIITFKKTDNIYSLNNTLYIDIQKSGLTGTTEQVVLLDKDENIIDAVCWQNSSPTSSELEDLEEIIIEDEWVGGCINSDEVNSSQSIGRSSIFDTNSLDDWEIYENPTKAQKNVYINNPPKAVITIQSGETEGYPPLSINLDGTESNDPENGEIEFFWDFGDKYIYESGNPPSHKFEEPGNYKITLSVTDNIGQTSSDFIIVTVLEENPIVPDNNSYIPTNSNIIPESFTVIPENFSVIPENSSVIPENSSVIPAQAGINNNDSSVFSGEVLAESIIINEFLPNPEGSDSGNEWIELKNLSNQNLQLTGLLIDDEEGGSKPYPLDSREIPGNGFLVIYSSDSKISLNNSEEKVRLILSDGQIIEEIYYEKSSNNKSFARDNNNNFFETDILTPGEENIFSSGLTDEIAQINTEGAKQAAISTNTITAITGSEEEKKSTSKTDKYTPERIYKNGDLSEEIIISEAFPNPKGKDGDNEWLELYNDGSKDINLGNWVIDDDEEGSKPYVFPDSTIIKSREYLVVSVTETNIPLANSSDEIHLLDFEDNVISEIFYEAAKENYSYALNKTIQLPEETEDINYIWTLNTTKGEANPVSYKFDAVVNIVTPPSSFSVNFNNSEINILYNTKNFPEDLLSNILNKGNKVNILAQQIDEQTYELQEIELISQADIPSSEEKKSDSNPINPLSVTLGSTTALSTSFLVYAKYKNQIFEIFKKLLKK